MKPQSVFFCNAYPVSKADFEAGHGKDFLQLYAAQKLELSHPFSWTVYEQEIVTPYKMFKETFKLYGFNFVENFTSENLRNLISEPGQQLIILFTHCKNGGLPKEEIELFDGLCKSVKILEGIPKTCDTILDLGVCNPQHLASLIRVHRPGCVTRYAKISISIVLWILFYAELFRNIIITENYFTSYENAVCKCWNK